VALPRGAVRRYVSAVGAGFELVIHSIFASVGLSALLAQSAVAFSMVKYAGATYLPVLVALFFR
jgi:threonine/homoserine/homoserine lactone efflux protein